MPPVVAPSARERRTRDTAVARGRTGACCTCTRPLRNLGGIEQLDQLRKCYVLVIFASTF